MIWKEAQNNKLEKPFQFEEYEFDNIAQIIPRFNFFLEESIHQLDNKCNGFVIK